MNYKNKYNQSVISSDEYMTLDKWERMKYLPTTDKPSSDENDDDDDTLEDIVTGVAIANNLGLFDSGFSDDNSSLDSGFGGFDGGDGSGGGGASGDF